MTPEAGRARSSRATRRVTPSSAGRSATSSPAGSRLGCVLLRVQRASWNRCRRARRTTLTGMNVSYDRERDRGDAGPAATRVAGRRGCTPRLRERGFGLLAPTRMVLDHDKDFGLGEFLSQRWHYSRSYAGHAERVARAPRATSTRSAHRCSRPCSTGAWRGTSSRAAGGGASSLVATPLIFLYCSCGPPGRPSAMRSAAGAAC